MDAREARDHLEMVDRILTNAEGNRRYRPFGPALIVIGLAAAMLQAGTQLGLDGHGYAVTWAGGALMLAGYIYFVWSSVSARRNAGRVSSREVLTGQASGAVWLSVVIAAFATPHVFAGWGGAAIWNLGGAIQMLMLGFFGDRRSLAGGFILAASMPVANYVSKPGYVLAAGFILGYVLPGVLKLFDRSEC